MLCHVVEIGILNVIEFASYQHLHFVWVLFYDSHSSFLNYQFLHYLVHICDCLSKNVPSSHNYKYHFEIFKFNISREGKEVLAYLSP